MHMLVKNSQNKWLNFDQIFIVPISEESGKFIEMGDLLKNPLLSRKGEIIKQITCSEFSTNQNAAKLEFTYNVLERILLFKFTFTRIL